MCIRDRDDTAEPGTPTNRLPSYLAMCELASQDPKVSGLLLQERWTEATEGFQASADVGDSSWMQQLKISAKSGLPSATIDNIWIILEHDPRLAGKFALNQFSGRGEVLGAVPWAKRAERRMWDDNDNAGLYWYLEKYYQDVYKRQG